MKQPYILAALFGAGLLAACSGSGVPAPESSPANAAQPPSVSEAVLHSFSGGPGDGANPFAGLVDVNGTLYGTTYGGGASRLRNGLRDHNFRQGNRPPQLRRRLRGRQGAVCGLAQRQRHALRHDLLWRRRTAAARFSRSRPSGKETSAPQLRRLSDGAEPYAGLLNVNGTLYGTTEFGGPYATTERSSRSQRPERKRVLHSFGAVRTTAHIRLRASSTSTARSTARRTVEARTATERSSRSQRPARKPCSTASRAARATANTRWRASSTSRARSTARP